MSAAVVFWLLFVIPTISVHGKDESGVDFYRLPPKSEMDDYDLCLLDSKDPIYCVATFDIVEPNETNPYYDKLKVKSASFHNFNYLLIRRALCLTSKCKQHLPNNFKHTHNNSELASIIEKCLNDRIWSTSKLNATINRIFICSDGRDFEVKRGTIDTVLSAFIWAIIIANGVSTILDVCFGSENVWILTFSIRRNWRLLTKPLRQPTEKEFDSISCIRVTLVFLMVLAHVLLLTGMSFVKNPETLETTRGNENSTMLQQFHFLISGFLLCYFFTKEAEKMRFSLWKIPLDILKRWWRLAPAIVVIIILRVVPFLDDKISSNLYLRNERKNCLESNALLHHALLLYNTFSRKGICCMEAWHSSADFQLSVVAIILLCLSHRYNISQLKTILIFLVTSVIFKFTTTVYYGLKPTFTTFNLKFHDHELMFNTPEFNMNYVSAHSNAPSYAVGLAFGYIYRQGQLRGWDLSKNRLFTLAYYMSIPGIYWCVFCMHLRIAPLGPIDGKYVPALFMITSQLIMSLLICVLLVGTFCVEGKVRNFMRASFFQFLAKLIYGVLIIHTTLIGLEFATSLQTHYVSGIRVFNQTIAFFVMSFIFAIPVYLMVEEPFYSLWKEVSQRLERALQVAKPIEVYKKAR